ncbi:MAG: alpha,alpha-trehalose-phosphate synthase (UDP-forming) [Terriglobales bacterium]
MPLVPERTLPQGSLLQEVTPIEGRRFVVVSNREPFAHVRTESGIKMEKPPSGLTLALEPMMQATRGTWIATASGNADAEFVDARGHVLPTPGVDYGLRRLFLPPRMTEDFYTGFSNSCLWPLCHIAYYKPRFEERWWRAYVRANEQFAEAVADEIGAEPAVVFVQDFQLALLPEMIRRRRPQAVIAQFWHIPWPNPEAFRICPWRRELLQGLLGNDLLGFHLPYHCNNFLDTVDRELQVRLDPERHGVVSSDRLTTVAAFPLSVDFSRIHARVRQPEAQAEAELLRQRHAQGRKLVLSVERMDYTKGILERIEAIQRLFERHPAVKEAVSFVHIATPSRTGVRAYRDYTAAVERAIARVNAVHGQPGWQPIHAMHNYVEPEAVWVWYHAADAVVVSSLHDGMNLVSKEFVAAGRDDGVLFLSEFTGASRELREAVSVNPYATDAFAEALATGLAMPEPERRERMRRLRWRVANADVGVWARDILRAIRQREFDAQNALFAPRGGAHGWNGAAGDGADRPQVEAAVVPRPARAGSH